MTMATTLENAMDGKKLPSESEMAANSPYQKEGSNPKPKTPQKGGSRKGSNADREIARIKAQLAQAHANAQAEAEKRPTVFLGEDTIRLDFPVLGVTRTGTDPKTIINSPEVKKLQGILLPIVSILNAAVRAKPLEETVLKIKDETKKGQLLEARDTDKRRVFKATPLTRARYAYSVIFSNPEVKKALSNLEKAIDAAMKDRLKAGEVRTVSYAPDKPLEPIPNPELEQLVMRQLEQVAEGMNMTEVSSPEPTEKPN